MGPRSVGMSKVAARIRGGPFGKPPRPATVAPDARRRGFSTRHDGEALYGAQQGAKRGYCTRASRPLACTAISSPTCGWTWITAALRNRTGVVGRTRRRKSVVGREGAWRPSGVSCPICSQDGGNQRLEAVAGAVVSQRLRRLQGYKGCASCRCEGSSRPAPIVGRCGGRSASWADAASSACGEAALVGAGEPVARAACSTSSRYCADRDA